MSGQVVDRDRGENEISAVRSGAIVTIAMPLRVISGIPTPLSISRVTAAGTVITVKPRASVKPTRNYPVSASAQLNGRLTPANHLGPRSYSVPGGGNGGSSGVPGAMTSTDWQLCGRSRGCAGELQSHRLWDRCCGRPLRGRYLRLGIRGRRPQLQHFAILLRGCGSSLPTE